MNYDLLFLFWDVFYNTGFQNKTKKQKIAFLDQQIVKQYKKLDALQQISSEIGGVRRALTNLEWHANDLSDLMDKLLEDKDADPELPFP